MSIVHNVHTQATQVRNAVKSSGRGEARSGTQSVERAFAVLNAVAAAHTTGTTLPAIMRVVRLNRTTAYRLLKCLIQQAAVRFDADSSRYFLGPLALELGISARQQLQFKELLSPVLTHIAEATGDTVFLLLRDGLESVCIDRRLGAYPVKTLVVEVGTRRPLGVGAASLAMLQAMRDDELKDVVRENGRHFASFGTTTAAVLKDARAAAKLGYVSARVPGVDGVNAIALPIIDSQGNPVAALAVAAITQRMSRSRQMKLLRIVRSEVSRAERLLIDGGVQAD